ncbi:glycosyltransferase family 2 protein [Methanosphaera cuniculi]|nr:glycosyltransferase family 2 protein [Methanosphaera cuniculi]
MNLKMQHEKQIVSIILLNWNGEKDTVECLKSLRKLDYQDYVIYLVDNDSRESSLKYIEKYLNESSYNSDIITSDDLNMYQKPDDVNLIFILNHENAGFAGGNNVALNYLIDNPEVTDYVLLLNNDTIIKPNLIDALLDKLHTDEKIGFIGVPHYYYDNPDKLQTIGGGFIDIKHAEAIACMEDKDEFDFITGSCIFMPIEVLKQIGSLPEDYFMYWEDVDWSTNARNHGYKLVITTDTSIYHKEGASIKSYKRIYYHTRNRIWYMRKYTNSIKYYKFLVYMILFVLKTSTTAKNEDDKDYAKTLKLGLKDALLNNKTII